jgi:hypothetical protein
LAVVAIDAGECLPARSAHARNDNLSAKRNSPLRYLDLAEYDLRSSSLGVRGKNMLARNTFHADFSRGPGTARLGAVCTRALIVIASKLFVPNSKLY